jgi:hypothetical protein
VAEFEGEGERLREVQPVEEVEGVEQEVWL